VNWLAPVPDVVDCAVKVRSTREPVPARVFARDGGCADVEMSDGERAVAPGQACVFYEEKGSRVLGGGWIVSTDAASALAPDRTACAAA